MYFYNYKMFTHRHLKDIILSNTAADFIHFTTNTCIEEISQKKKTIWPTPHC